jgi:CheY-like chemotaxis protein/two-component sensor histidine kinase
MGIDLLGLSANITGAEREPLNMMRAALEFISDTIDNVLNLQKMEEGKFNLEMAPFSFKDCIDKLFLIFNGSVVKKNISLNLNILSNVPSQLIGDSHRILHVIGNLLSNAIKFSPNNKSIYIEVQSELITKDSDGNEVANVIFTIEDEGPGISKENQKSLFNIFFQITPGASQQNKGSGLGLMFCKEIVHMHGGTIWVTSEEGKGSKFHFSIPFSIPSPQSSPLQIASPSANTLLLAKAATSDPLQTCAFTPITSMPIEDGSVKNGIFNYLDNDSEINRKLLISLLQGKERNGPDVDESALSKQHTIDLKYLVVDDSLINRKMLMSLLEAKGLCGDTAKDGQETVDIILKDLEYYKLIFIDNDMPVMNGIEATRVLRTAGYCYLIVAITGTAMEEDINEFLLAGADLVFPKPCKLSTLEVLLNFIELSGSLSSPDSRLVPCNGSLCWAPRP